MHAMQTSQKAGGHSRGAHDDLNHLINRKELLFIVLTPCSLLLHTITTFVVLDDNMDIKSIKLSRI